VQQQGRHPQQEQRQELAQVQQQECTHEDQQEQQQHYQEQRQHQGLRQQGADMQGACDALLQQLLLACQQPAGAAPGLSSQLVAVYVLALHKAPEPQQRQQV
jgi:hypothetical protein